MGVFRFIPSNAFRGLMSWKLNKSSQQDEKLVKKGYSGRTHTHGCRLGNRWGGGGGLPFPPNFPTM